MTNRFITKAFINTRGHPRTLRGPTVLFLREFNGGVERERTCETAGRAGAGLVHMILRTRDARFGTEYSKHMISLNFIS